MSIDFDISNEDIEYKTLDQNDILNFLSIEKNRKTIPDKAILYIYDYKEDICMTIEYNKQNNIFYMTKTSYNDYYLRIENQECLIKINTALNIENIIKEIICQ